MKTLPTILLTLICSTWNIFGAAMTTLTNFNAVYFLVDPNPAAIPTNVVLLSGNLTNWQKFSTNVLISINPTDGILPVRSSASSFADSFATNLAAGIGVLHGGTNSIELIGGSSAQLSLHAPVGGPATIYSDDAIIFNVSGNGNPPSQAWSVGNLTLTPMADGLATLGTIDRSLLGSYVQTYYFWTNNTFDSALTINPEGVITSDPGSTWRNTTTGVIWRKATGTGNTGWEPLMSASDNLWTNIGGVLQPSNLTLPLMITNQLVFGPGSTNVVYRDVETLRYNSTYPSGYSIGFNAEHTAGGALSLLAGTSKVATFWDGTVTLPLYGGIQFMVSGDTYSGAGGVTFRNEGNGIVGLHEFTTPSTFRVYGYTNAITGGYSRMAFNQASTNDVYVIDLETSGDAGDPRAIEIRTNGVPIYRIPVEIWDDSQVPQTTIRLGSTAPTTAPFNGGPVNTLMFQNNRDDTVEFSVQLSHTYKQGTDVAPHVHWCETAATGAGTNVVWELVSCWGNVSAAFPAYSTNYVTNAITGTNWFMQLAEFPHLNGAGKTVSSVFVCQLRRLANSATADNYDKNVAFLGIDMHHQISSPGSDSELTKSFP